MEWSKFVQGHNPDNVKIHQKFLQAGRGLPSRSVPRQDIETLVLDNAIPEFIPVQTHYGNAVADDLYSIGEKKVLKLYFHDFEEDVGTNWGSLQLYIEFNKFRKITNSDGISQYILYNNDDNLKALISYDKETMKNFELEYFSDESLQSVTYTCDEVDISMNNVFEELITGIKYTNPS